MSLDPRLAAAVLTGKSVAISSRLLRRGGGTTLPGDAALLVDPGLLRKLGDRLPGGVVLVTGTNGKTTTTGILASILETAGEEILTNRSASSRGASMLFSA